MANSPGNIVICSCEDTMPLDGELCRRAAAAPKSPRHAICAGRRSSGSARRPQRRSADHCLHAGSPLCSTKWRAKPDARPPSPTPTSAKRGLVARRPPTPGRRWPRCWRQRPSRCRPVAIVNLESEGVILIYGCDERAVEAGNLLKDHLDVTVLIKPPATISPPRSTEFPIVQGTIRAAKGHLGAFEITVDDFASRRPPRAALAIRPIARRRAIALRRHPGSLRRRRAVPGRRPARWLSARRRQRSRGDSQGGAEGPRPRRHLREAALHHLQRRSVRAFALAHRRLQPLPRSLSHRRHHARRQSCGHRRPDLRGLRTVRGSLSDGCGILCVAAGRCADAQAAHPADDLSRRRRRATPLCCCTTRRMASH